MTAEIPVRPLGDKDPKKIWNATFVSVFIVNGLMYLGQWMSNAIFAKYVAHLGASSASIGFIVSAFAYTALAFKFISAPAIDTFNRKYILFGAMCVMGVACFGYSISTSNPSLVVFRLIQGSGQAFTATCCLALAADALPQDRLGSGLGIFAMAQAAFQAIGPTIGLTVAAHFGYHMTFALASLCMFAGAAFALRIRLNFVRSKTFRITFDNVLAKEALIPAVLMLLFSSAFSVITAFLVVDASERGIPLALIGYFFTVYAGTLLLTRPLVGRLSDRLGAVKVLVPSIFCFACAFYIISISDSLWRLLLAAFVAAFGFGACQPVVQSLAMRMVAKERRGAASCTSYLGTDLGQLLGPVVAGFVAQHLGYVVMWQFMIIPILLALVVVIAFRGKVSTRYS